MPARLRIVQLVHAPQRRGAEVFARTLAGALRTRGHQVTTVYLYRPPCSAPAAGETLVEPGDVCLGFREGRSWEGILGVHPSLASRLRRTLADLDPDVVQANGGGTLKYAALASGGRRWRLVYRNVGDPGAWVDSPLRRVVYRRWVGPRIDGIAAVSESALPALRALYGRDKTMVVLPTAVDLDGFAPRRTREAVRAETETPLSATVAVFAGSLSREKRVDRLLRAVASAGSGLAGRGPALHLWILGTGPLRAAVERQVAELGLTPVVRLLGVREDLADFVAAGDFLALASDTEGIPGVILEAGALGVPAVAPRVGGVAECIRHRETGLLVEPGDEGALAAAITELALDRDRRQALGEGSRRLVAERFALEPVVSGYESLYRRLLDGSGENREGA